VDAVGTTKELTDISGGSFSYAESPKPNTQTTSLMSSGAVGIAPVGGEQFSREISMGMVVFNSRLSFYRKSLASSYIDNPLSQWYQRILAPLPS
jgi:hypothetical protein